MDNKGARNLFIFGSLGFFIIFALLCFDTMGKIDGRAPVITDQIANGKYTWQKYDCIGCHTILGNGSYFAPDMTKIAKNRPQGYLVKFLMNPRKVNPKAAMPVLGISENEAKDLVAFLDWISKVDTNGWPPEPILKAQASASMIYTKYECADCHAINGIGGTSGPDLSHIATIKPDAEWHRRHLANPESVVPDSAMPAFDKMSKEEMDELLNYLMTLK